MADGVEWALDGSPNAAHWIADAAGDLFQAARYPMDHDLRDAPDPEPLRRVARGLLTRLVDIGT